MAYFSRSKKYGWRYQIERRGIRISKSGFPTKNEAEIDAARKEAEILDGERGVIPAGKTVGDLLARYREDKVAHKDGECRLLLNMEADDKLASIPLRVLGPQHVSAWQDRRLKCVQSATVRRERNTMRRAFEIARKEWKWLRSNPFMDVERPKDNAPRKRKASFEESAILLAAASPGFQQLITIAEETGMRLSEIYRAEINGTVAHLSKTKNGDARDVPLSTRALKAYEGGLIMSKSSVSSAMRNLRQKTGIEGLRFHDLRRTAASRLAKKLHVMDLAKMTGHKDVKMLLNVYYQNEPSEIAKLLD